MRARSSQITGRAPAVGSRLRLLLLLRVGETLGLILNLNRYFPVGRAVFPAVVGAEEQLTRIREQDADISLRAAAVAEVQGGQRLGGGYGSGHVAFLVSCLPA